MLLIRNHVTDLNIKTATTASAMALNTPVSIGAADGSIPLKKPGNRYKNKRAVIIERYSRFFLAQHLVPAKSLLVFMLCFFKFFNLFLQLRNAFKQLALPALLTVYYF